MHSDTIIVVVSLFVMIVLGLVFRKCCMKLSTVNSRKKRIQGGLRQIGEHMNYVTRYFSLWSSRSADQCLANRLDDQ